ncbi:hypothetical protein FSP39_003452 [Pinctada imbricata]|uniref:G-patch domain-containing protein n=1 Tax=Pinctada imbricata TaxID=66713 RepID=A0AA89BR69_PINIB|nr:hypothetical protein FSP39_003452 [Pinctada imbricata]
MDELVQDLAHALEESAQPSTSRSHTSIVKRHHKKRKGKKRRTVIEGGNMSEASESSIDEAFRDYIESIAQMSDSDDLALSHQVARLSLPPDTTLVPSVESDSVNENFSPIRPQRRRKKYKTMAVDVDPSSEIRSDFLLPNSDVKPKYKAHRLSSGGMNMVDQYGDSLSSNMEGFFPGKRKRSSKSTSKMESSGALGKGADIPEDQMEANIQESSSSLSSSESDGLLTNDEGREADDEQSDFYYESGPASGIPGIIKWWENDSEDGEMESDKQFQQIMNGSFEHLPRSSQLAFRARVTKMIAKTGREFRFGRRKLKEKSPGYTVSRFLEDQQMWNSMQGILTPGRHGTGNGNGNNYPKRRKKTPPPPTTGFICENADPIPESNIGNKMLQSMGWTPGSGLGPDGGGIKTPIMAHRRQKRQGLGCSSHPYSRSLNDS